MKVENIYIVNSDSVHLELHTEATILPHLFTELYQTEDRKWFVRTIHGVREIGEAQAMMFINK